MGCVNLISKVANGLQLIHLSTHRTLKLPEMFELNQKALFSTANSKGCFSGSQ